MNTQNKIHPLTQNNKGIALIMVLSMIVFVIVLVQETVFDTQIAYRSAVADLNAVKAYYSAKAGMEVNILRVKTYLQLTKSHGNKPEIKPLIPYMNLIWQFPFGWPPSQPENSTSLHAQEIQKLTEKSLMKNQFITFVQPENSRIDVQDLASPIPSLRKWTFVVLFRLIRHLQSEHPALKESLNEQEIRDILNNIKDWVDMDQQKGHSTMSETSLYEQEGLPPHRSFVSKQELKQVAGVSPLLYNALEPFISIYGEKGLNINTAPVELLMALHEEFPKELAQEIVALRSHPVKPILWNKKNFMSFLNEKGFSYLSQALETKEDNTGTATITSPAETSTEPSPQNTISYIYFDTPHNFTMQSTGWAGEVRRTITAVYFDTPFVIKRFRDLLQKEIKREKQKIQAQLAQSQVRTSTSAFSDQLKEPISPPLRPPPVIKPMIIYWKESF